MKKLLALVLALTILFSLGCQSADTYADPTVSAAKALFDLGLLKGTGDTFSEEAMDLERIATRAELSVTVTRMLGKDEKAKYQQNPHPFTDVPDWASDYVGWLYENYLVNGNSDTYFGADENASIRQFCTMMLRVLGYSDADGDFSYDKAKEFAKEVGLLAPDQMTKSELYRSDMVRICHKALTTPLKNSNRLLCTKLMDEKVFTPAQAAAVGLNTVRSALADYFVNSEENLPVATARKSGSTVKISFGSPVEEYGVRVFYTSSDSPSVKELPVTKGKVSYQGATGYISNLTVTVSGENIELIVIKASSEGALYKIRGKSNIMKL